MAETKLDVTGRRGFHRARLGGVLGVLAACTLVASCSSSSDALTQLGLSPASLESAASAEDEATSTQTEENAAAAQPSAEVEDSTRTAEAASQDPEVANASETDGGTVTADTSASRQAAQIDIAESSAAGNEQPQKRTLFDSLFSAKTQGEEAEGTASEDSGNGQGAAEAAAAPTTRAGEEADSGAEDSEADADERRGFLSAFFSPQQSAANAITEKVQRDETRDTGAREEPQQVAARSREDSVAPIAGSALPGVRSSEQLFEIKRGDGNGNDLDVYEQQDLYQVASAAGLARLAPNGLLKQRESVDVSCFKPKLVRTLKVIERHFGKRIVVTSGYRSPEHNRRVRGARRSRHMSCEAADIQIEGVSKWELARYARSLPGRGGVGTYCRTKSIHVDIGPERDWNWRC